MSRQIKPEAIDTEEDRHAIHKLEDLVSMLMADRDRAASDSAIKGDNVSQLAAERDLKIEEIVRLNASLQELTAAHHALGLHVQTLTSEMQTIKASADKARTEAIEYQSYLEGEAETAKADVLEAASALGDVQDRYDWVSQEHQELQNQIDALAEEKQREADEASRLVTEWQSKHASLGVSMSREMQELTGELDAARIAANKYQQESSDYTSLLESDVDQSKSDIMQAAADMECLQNELDSKAAEATALQFSLDLSKSERDTKVHDLASEMQTIKASADKARTEAIEYATHLEEQVESSQVCLSPFSLWSGVDALCPCIGALHAYGLALLLFCRPLLCAIAL